jgi:hypothetical protein
MKQKGHHLRELSRMKEVVERQQDELHQQKEEINFLRDTPGERTAAAAPVYIREKKVKSFSGQQERHNEPELEDWILSVERVTRGRSGQDTMDFILEHLTGDAYEEVKHRPPHQRSTVHKVLDILRKAFGDGQYSKAQLQRMFYNRRQRKGESVRRYSHALLSLMERLHPQQEGEHDPMLKEQFSEHVNNSALRRELKKMCRADEEMSFIELRDEAIAWIGEDEMDDEDTDSDKEELTVQQQTVHQTVGPPCHTTHLEKVVQKNLALTESLVGTVAALESKSLAYNPPQSLPAASSTPVMNSQQYPMVGPAISTSTPFYPRMNYSQQPSFYNFTPEGRPICFKCGKPGHVGRVCQSSPDWDRERGHKPTLYNSADRQGYGSQFTPRYASQVPYAGAPPQGLHPQQQYYGPPSNGQYSETPHSQQYSGTPHSQQYRGNPNTKQYSGTSANQQYSGTQSNQPYSGTSNMKQYSGTPNTPQYRGTYQSDQANGPTTSRQYQSIEQQQGLATNGQAATYSGTSASTQYNSRPVSSNHRGTDTAKNLTGAQQSYTGTSYQEQGNSYPQHQ